MTRDPEQKINEVYLVRKSIKRLVQDRSDRSTIAIIRQAGKRASSCDGRSCASFLVPPMHASDLLGFRLSTFEEEFRLRRVTPCTLGVPTDLPRRPFRSPNRLIVVVKIILASLVLDASTTSPKWTPWRTYQQRGLQQLHLSRLLRVIIDYPLRRPD
jgi:hypothetical protein